MSARRLRLAPANLPEIRDRVCELVRRTRAEPPKTLEPYMRVLLRGAWRTDESLSVAPCWWVSADMEELAVEARIGAPRDVLPETSTGFLVFQRPLPSEVLFGISMPVQGVSWITNRSHGEVRASISLYTPYREMLASASESGRRNVLDVGSPLVPIPEFPGPHAEAMMDIMRAVWALSSEERICETRTVTAPWPAGGGGQRPDPMARTVKMLVLREPPKSSGSGGGEGGSGRYSHRFVVRGFWRNQPCGPHNSERRLTWVAPFIKGPEGAPLVERETVRVWKR